MAAATTTVAGTAGAWRSVVGRALLPAGTLVEDGWTAEMAIPSRAFATPRTRTASRTAGVFQVQREIQSRNEAVVWAPVSRDVMGFLAQMGTIEGMQQLSMSRNLELLPTVTTIN